MYAHCSVSVTGRFTAKQCKSAVGATFTWSDGSIYDYDMFGVPKKFVQLQQGETTTCVAIVQWLSWNMHAIPDGPTLLQTSGDGSGLGVVDMTQLHDHYMTLCSPYGHALPGNAWAYALVRFKTGK